MPAKGRKLNVLPRNAQEGDLGRGVAQAAHVQVD